VLTARSTFCVYSYSGPYILPFTRFLPLTANVPQSAGWRLRNRRPENLNLTPDGAGQIAFPWLPKSKWILGYISSDNDHGWNNPAQPEPRATWGPLNFICNVQQEYSKELRWPERETDHSSRSDAQIMYAPSYVSNLPYVFTA